MTDLYIFAKPGDPRIDHHLQCAHVDGRESVGAYNTRTLRPGALYEIKVDTDGDVLPTSVTATISLQIGHLG